MSRLPLAALANIVSYLVDSVAKVLLPIAKLDVFLQWLGNVGVAAPLPEESVQSTRNSWFSADNSPSLASALASRDAEELFSNVSHHGCADSISALLTTTRFPSRYANVPGVLSFFAAMLTRH